METYHSGYDDDLPAALAERLDSGDAFSDDVFSSGSADS